MIVNYGTLKEADVDQEASACFSAWGGACCLMAAGMPAHWMRYLVGHILCPFFPCQVLVLAGRLSLVASVFVDVVVDI